MVKHDVESLEQATPSGAFPIAKIVTIVCFTVAAIMGGLIVYGELIIGEIDYGLLKSAIQKHAPEALADCASDVSDVLIRQHKYGDDIIGPNICRLRSMEATLRKENDEAIAEWVKSFFFVLGISDEDKSNASALASCRHLLDPSEIHLALYLKYQREEDKLAPGNPFRLLEEMNDAGKTQKAFVENKAYQTLYNEIFNPEEDTSSKSYFARLKAASGCSGKAFVCLEPTVNCGMSTLDLHWMISVPLFLLFLMVCNEVFNMVWIHLFGSPISYMLFSGLFSKCGLELKEIGWDQGWLASIPMMWAALLEKLTAAAPAAGDLADAAAAAAGAGN